MKATIFYSWQSDTKAAANRTFIQAALENAVQELHADDSISIEPVVERDTWGVPGAPDIGSTILKKIDDSAVLVADVTIVGRGSGERPIPNPNVLIELGYGLKALGSARVILVQNVAFGGPEELPFDLRQRRTLTYNSPEDMTDRASERRRLQASLKQALTLVLSGAKLDAAPAHRVDLSIDFKKLRISSERHDYELGVRLTNIDTKPITEWHVDLQVPVRLLDSQTTHAAMVRDRNTPTTAYFRATNQTHGGPIYPGDTRLAMTVDYRIDGQIFRDLRGLFDERVSAVAYVHGEIAASTEKVVREIQMF
jgi:hypothetical protein